MSEPGADTADRIPSLTFDSAQFAPEQALALWRASVPYDAYLPEGVGPERFFTRLTAWRLDTLVVTVGAQIAMRFVRTAERVAEDARDNFCLMMVQDQDWACDFDGLRHEVPRGRVCVVDFGRPFAANTTDSRFVMLSVPRPTLAVGVDGGLHGRVLGGAPGALLASHLRALAEVLPETPAGDAAVLAEATLALVRPCLAHTPPRERSRAVLSLRQRVRAYVNAHLTDLSLTPERIADALAITRSTLYRAFPSAGVATYIQQRRLEAIRARLDSPAETRTLAELADAFGFASHAHLTTAFRRRFGQPPSAARRREAGGSEASAADAFQTWLAELDASAQARAGEDAAGARRA